MSDQYSFVTKWKIQAPLEDVWNEIYNSLNWPDWWKGVIYVQDIQKGSVSGKDSIRRYTWKSVLPYQLTFNVKLTEIEEHKMLVGTSIGDLAGKGSWYFSYAEGVTHVQYFWNVTTKKAWMNRFSFILRPAFIYNHKIIMRWGAKGLAKKLNANLISC